MSLINNEILDGALKLALSLVAGSIIGAEREYKSKSVGFRTVILITIGSCLFTILSVTMAGHNDPTRIAANIITGIGFLGAGAIFKEGASVKGVTTASTIWVAAAIGMAIGSGQYEFAFLSLIIIMVVLLGFSWFQQIIDKTNTYKQYKITLVGHSEAKIKELQNIFNDCNVKAQCTHYTKRNNEMILEYTVSGSQVEHEKLVRQFYDTSLIDAFEN